VNTYEPDISDESPTPVGVVAPVEANITNCVLSGAINVASTSPPHVWIGFIVKSTCTSVGAPAVTPDTVNVTSLGVAGLLSTIGPNDAASAANVVPQLGVLVDVAVAVAVALGEAVAVAVGVPAGPHPDVTDTLSTVKFDAPSPLA